MSDAKPFVDEIGKDGKYFVKKSTFDPERLVLDVGHKDTESPGMTYGAKYIYKTPDGEKKDWLIDHPPTESALYGTTQYTKGPPPTISTKWEMVTGWKIGEKLPEGFSKEEDFPVVERDANRNIVSVKDREREFYIHEGPTGNARRDEVISFGDAVLESTQLGAKIESTILEKAILLMGKPLKNVTRVVAANDKTGLVSTKVALGQSKAKADFIDPVTGKNVEKGTMVTSATVFVGEKQTIPLHEFIKKSAGARVQVRRSWPSIHIDTKNLTGRVRCSTFTVLAKRLGDDPADKSAWISAHADDGVDDEEFESAKRVKVDDEVDNSFFQDE